MLTVETVRAALQEVMDPELNRNLVELGMVHDIDVDGSTVRFTLALTTMACPLRGEIQEDARAHLLALEGVEKVEITLREMTEDEKEATFGKSQPEEGSAERYNHIKQVVAVLSGKGGVGKSSRGRSTWPRPCAGRGGIASGLLDAGPARAPVCRKMLGLQCAA